MTAPQKQNQWDEYLLSPPVPDLGPGATTDRICPGSGKRQTLKPSRVWKRMPFIEMKEYRGQSERDEEEARSFILGYVVLRHRYNGERLRRYHPPSDSVVNVPLPCNDSQ